MNKIAARYKIFAFEIFLLTCHYFTGWNIFLMAFASILFIAVLIRVASLFTIDSASISGQYHLYQLHLKHTTRKAVIAFTMSILYVMYSMYIDSAFLTFLIAANYVTYLIILLRARMIAEMNRGIGRE